MPKNYPDNSYSHVHHEPNKKSKTTLTDMMTGIAGENRVHSTSCIIRNQYSTQKIALHQKMTLTTIQVRSATLPLQRKKLEVLSWAI